MIQSFYIMKTLTVKSNIENVAAVTDFIAEFSEALDCPMKVQFQLNVAIDEIFSNISHYAYGDGIGDVTVSIDETPEKRGIVMIFSDSGMHYDPLEHEDPDVTLSVEKRAIGGLGLFIVKKTMDEVTYKFEDGKNILTLKKYF